LVQVFGGPLEYKVHSSKCYIISRCSHLLHNDSQRLV